MSDGNDELITIRVSKKLIEKTIIALDCATTMPATYVVDQALREIIKSKEA